MPNALSERLPEFFHGHGGSIVPTTGFKSATFADIRVCADRHHFYGGSTEPLRATLPIAFAPQNFSH
jgi:hypothetical protein